MRSVRYLMLVLFSFLCVSTARAQESDLDMRAMISLIQKKPDAFSQEWDARRLARLDKYPADKREVEWQWASGLINYPYFHRRETGEAVRDDWAPKVAAIASIDFGDVSALKSPAFIELIGAWLHEEGGRLIKAQAEFKKGDNRWLRAKFALIEQAISNPVVKRFFLARELTTHIDDNGARHTAREIQTLEEVGAEHEQVKTYKSALVQEETMPDDHQIKTYRQVDGVDLQAHIFSPKHEANVAPAFIWFHGGSWEKGHWSHCPVLCRSLQAQGFVVVQVEYRTSQRFDGTPLDALSDAYAVIDWVRQHAKELGVNPMRIMTGGFSSGGALASQMAVLNHGKVKAGAYISGCYDPSADTWYSSVVSPITDPKTLSPLLKLDATSPPQIFFQAKDDEMCSYGGAQEMHRKLQALPKFSSLNSFEGGGHFFVFRSPEARERIKKEMAVFVRQLGWQVKND